MGNTELSEFDKKSMQDAWVAADTRHRENENTFLKYIFTFSSALLGFFITLTTSILERDNIDINKIYLTLCWLSIILTIIVGLLSLLISKKANELYMENLQRELDGENKSPNNYDKACGVLEWILFLLLIISMLSNIAFIIYYI